MKHSIIKRITLRRSRRGLLTFQPEYSSHNYHHQHHHHHHHPNQRQQSFQSHFFSTSSDVVSHHQRRLCQDEILKEEEEDEMTKIHVSTKDLERFHDITSQTQQQQHNSPSLQSNNNNNKINTNTKNKSITNNRIDDDDNSSSSSSSIHQLPEIHMSDYTYKLNPESIAIHPARPRGSSRLLHLSTSNNNNKNKNNKINNRNEQKQMDIIHYPHFSKVFANLVSKTHVVFNDTSVLDARLFVYSEKDKDDDDDDDEIEMMILNWEQNMDQNLCHNTKLNVMIRKEHIQVGDVFLGASRGDNNYGQCWVSFHVQSILGSWIEDEQSQGNGTECIVQCCINNNYPKEGQQQQRQQQQPKCQKLSMSSTMADLLHHLGTVPIPPYIHRTVQKEDEIDYHTIYGTNTGSVAAPTAGLHFTSKLMNDLLPSSSISFLSLHVGAGTFKPVIAKKVQDHLMHSESFMIRILELKQIIQALIAYETQQPLTKTTRTETEKGEKGEEEEHGGITAVGTTSARTLESLYWCGVKQLLKNNELTTTTTTTTTKDDDDKNEEEEDHSSSEPNILTLGQFEWFDLTTKIGKHNLPLASTAFTALLSNHHHKNNNEEHHDDNDILYGETNLMIIPNGKTTTKSTTTTTHSNHHHNQITKYEFQVVDHLLTNFHAPDSTLILLVSSFLEGKTNDIFDICTFYENAQNNGYKFLSYGDVCFFSNPRTFQQTT